MEGSLRIVRVGSAWLLTAAAAMFATAVSYSTPAGAQTPPLPEVCATFAQPVIVYVEHDVPLRKVIAAVLEGHDGAQASAFLNNDGCGTPAPRALNVLPGHHPGADGMSLRAMAEMRPAMFNLSNVEGARFASVGDILCTPGNEHVFEAQYRLVHNVPANAEEIDADAGVPTDAGFVREEERETLHLDCGNIRRNPSEPRHWFRESVPHHAAIYIGARGGHNVVLPRGGIARPTELACRSLATLADNPTDDVALVALRSALRDPEPVDASVRAIAVTRITNIAIDLARRSRVNEGDPRVPRGQAEELRLARLEVRRLNGTVSAVRGENRDLRGSISTLKELPIYLGVGIIVLLGLFIFFVHWAFTSNDRLALIASKAKEHAAKAFEEGERKGWNEVFRFAAESHSGRVGSEYDALPILVRERDAWAWVAQVTKRYDEVVIPPLLAEMDVLEKLLESLSWAVLYLFPKGDPRQNPGFIGVPPVKVLAQAAVDSFYDAIEAHDEEIRRAGDETAAALSEELATWRRAPTDASELTLVVLGLGRFVGKSLSKDHPLLPQMVGLTADPIQIPHGVIAVLEEERHAVREALIELVKGLAHTLEGVLDPSAEVLRDTVPPVTDRSRPADLIDVIKRYVEMIVSFQAPAGTVSTASTTARVRRRGPSLPGFDVAPANESGLVGGKPSDPIK